MGQLLASTVAKRKEEQVRVILRFVQKSAVLSSSHSNIHLFLAAVVLRARWRYSMCDSSVAHGARVAASVDALTEDQASCLGVLFANILEDVASARGSVDRACDLFFSAVPSMAKMAESFIWFGPLLAGMAEGLKPGVHSDCQWPAYVEYDRSRRHARMAQMGSEEPQYTAAEVQAFDAGLSLLDSNGRPGSVDKSLRARYTTFESVHASYDKARGRIICGVECLVRGVTPEELCTFHLNHDSKILASYEDEYCVRSEILEEPHAHHTVTLVERRATGIRNRLFLNSVVCKKLSDSPVTYLLVAMPLPTHDEVHSDDQKRAITAESMRSYRFTRVEGGTRLEYGSWLDLKGLVPQWVNAPYDQQVYFQQARPLHECTAEDGRVVGRMLMRHSTLDSKRVFVLRTAMLRECSFPRIGDMLVALLAAAPTADAPSDCEDAPSACEDAPSAAEDLSSLTIEQAAALGRRLASSLHRGASLDEAVQSHRNLCAMRSQYAWFVPMLEVVSVRETAQTAERSRAPTFFKRLSSIVSVDAMTEELSVPPVNATSYADGIHQENNFTSVVMAPKLSLSRRMPAAYELTQESDRLPHLLRLGTCCTGHSDKSVGSSSALERCTGQRI